MIWQSEKSWQKPREVRCQMTVMKRIRSLHPGEQLWLRRKIANTQRKIKECCYITSTTSKFCCLVFTASHNEPLIISCVQKIICNVKSKVWKCNHVYYPPPNKIYQRKTTDAIVVMGEMEVSKIKHHLKLSPFLPPSPNPFCEKLINEWEKQRRD